VSRARIPIAATIGQERPSLRSQKGRRSIACVGSMTCCNHAGLAGRAGRGDNDNSRLSWSPTTETRMDKFLVLYRAPNSVIDEWMKRPEQDRKPEETKMMEAWKKWMSTNGGKLTDKGAGAGKPKVVSSSGVKDARNDIMMYQIV